MPGVIGVPDFKQVRLRSSRRFRLVGYDALAVQEQDALRGLAEEPDFFGLLVPMEGSALPAKSVSRDAALLFMALREAVCAPRLLTSLFGNQASERLQPLILDGVLEVELDGQFVSGPAALALLGDRQGAASTTRVAQLSEQAIEYAAALEGMSVQELATRLYLFNTMPANPAWLRQLGDTARFDTFLFEGGDVRTLLQSRWRREAIADSWIGWRTGDSAAALPYKLYVSPAAQALPRVLAIAVEALPKVGCTHFKLGQGAPGLLRPDKFVAYFAGLDDLYRAAELIRAETAGIAAHGVPFTGPIDSEGLLSWGMDPPRFEQVLQHQQCQSWRQWLTARIAVCVATAREAGADALAFVRGRIALDGVDPKTWNPDLAIWRGPVGTEQEVA